MTTKLLLFIALLAVASAAGAQTPGAPVNVSDSAGLSSSPAAVTDATGTIHVAWTDSADAEDPSEQYVLYARSFDGGASFEPPRQVSAPAGASMRSARQVRLVADRSGEVQLAWWDTTVDGSGRRFATAFVATSRDGGR
ncbi:MAG TPA: sialidase family protein [Blastocatellia bacterium]|nr:sialidase family protein [Blastocatellia bacterium]